jgi:hypothetical protein
MLQRIRLEQRRAYLEIDLHKDKTHDVEKVLPTST